MNKGVTNTQLAYIAGLLDGEGSLYIGRYPRKGNRSLGYRAYMTISNTHVPTLQWVKSIMGGKIVEMAKKGGCYSLTFTTNTIREWLPELLPYLLIKDSQAKVLLSFLDKQEQNAFAAVPEELLAFYEKCHLKLRALKRIRYAFKEALVNLGECACQHCGTNFTLTSRSPKKKFCTRSCKNKDGVDRFLLRLSAGA